MAEKAKGIPENSSVVIPRLVCKNPAAAIDFSVKTFGAVSLNERPGPDGEGRPRAADDWPRDDHDRRGMAVPAEPRPARGWQFTGRDLRLRGRRRSTVDRAAANGAQVLVPPQNQFWGDRIAWIMDPSGHVWTVASRIEQTTAEERTERWSEILRHEER